MKRLLPLLLVLFLASLLKAQDISSQLDLANKQLSNRGEVYFSFPLKSKADINLLTRQISIDKVDGNTVVAYANQKEFNKFLEYSDQFNVLTPPSLLENVAMSDNPKQVLTWNYYPTYTAYESIMAQFASDHPDICKLVTIGTLASGRKLLAVKITRNPDVQENEPEFLYTSSIHGDETTGYVLMLHLIDYILSNYGTDDRITNMVNSMEIYINPLANPDGTYKGGNSSVNGATRTNANNVDLNRNYADPEDGQHPDGNPWQPETVAFMNFAGFHHFVMSANFHGGNEVLNYPWDTWPRLAADDNWWQYVCREYADTVHLYSPTTYMSGFNNGISNGYAWYSISGGRQDYMNYFRNCREVTIEISDTKLLPENQLINHWNYNYRSFLNYLEESTYSLQGLVTDSISGEPLNARIFIYGHDIDSSQVNTDPAVGDYHRMLKAGTYNVTYSAAGYISKTITVQIVDRQKTIQNVQLYDGRLATNFSCDSATIPVGGTVHFTDRSAGSPQSWHWEFEGGSPSVSNDQNPFVNYTQPGKYSVKLVTTRPGSSDSLLRQAYIDVRMMYLMGNQSYTVCDALFLDSGGLGAGYSNNESSVVTFLPEQPNTRLKVDFNSFNVESSVDCQSDYLKVFDGTDTNATLLGTFCGSSLPQEMMASNVAGALTFQFVSNGSVNASGWEAVLECDSNVGIPLINSNPFRLYPNPNSNGWLRIESLSKISTLSITDILGHELKLMHPNSNDIQVQCDFPDGCYIFRMQIGDHVYSSQVIILKRK
ncbi:MAG: T9SS type A sorting domain-containing protein [Bacteroidetes bacterium]|nr:T9SS type A sorting domain-containing protein [Bacteroidota bacterium]